MSVSFDCRENRDLVGRRAFLAWGVRGGVCLTCVLALVGLARIEAAAAPASRPAGLPIAQLMMASEESEESDDSAAPRMTIRSPALGQPVLGNCLSRNHRTPKSIKESLPNRPIRRRIFRRDSLSEQLEAISKLAIQVNKAGLRVHPAMVPLFRSMILHYSGGSYKNAPIRFRLHVPEPFQEGKKYPLVVWLHGAGESGSDNLNQMSLLHAIIPYLVGPKKRDFFLLLPQCPLTHVPWETPEICFTTVRGGGVECHLTDDPVARGDAPLSYTLAMIEAVMKEFPIDPNRVAVAGASTGGEGVWRILERRPDLFAAAAPMVSWQGMQDKSLREKPLLKKIPIWAIYSSDDRGIDFARKQFERMRDAGCRVYRTEFGVCGHNAFTPAMLQGDVFGWLISRAKTGDRFYAAARSPTDPEKIGIFADVAEGDPTRTPTRAVRREPAGEANQQPAPAVARSSTVGPDGGGQAVTAQGRVEIAPRGPFPYAVAPQPSRTSIVVRADSTIDELRLELMARYLAMGETKKALAVANKVKNRCALARSLLVLAPRCPEVLDYVDRELDEQEQIDRASGATWSSRGGARDLVRPRGSESPQSLEPIPAGHKNPMEECGKEWAMSPTTIYGLFPNGWEQEGAMCPATSSMRRASSSATVYSGPLRRAIFPP